MREIKIDILESGEIDAHLDRHFSEFIKESDNGTIFHAVGWNQIVQQIFQTRLYLLLARNKETLLGFMPVHLIRIDSRRVNAYSPPGSYEVPYGGPVFRKGLSYEDCSNILNVLLDATARIGKGISIHLHTSPNSALIGNTYSKDSRICETGLVFLEPSLDDIWMGLQTMRRRNVRKAKKNGVVLQWGGCELLDHYYPMVQELSRKTGITMQPKSYYHSVLSHFSPHDEARLYLTQYNGEYLSGGIFLRFGKKGYYWHGAAYAHGERLGQNELIHWSVIEWLKESGCSMYDMVVIERDRLPDIAFFKMGFVGEIVPYEYICFAPFKNKIYRGIHYLRSPSDMSKYLSGILGRSIRSQ
ncbi:MAG: lipid II:glycine glycyltransferase FemX [bacterium]